LTKKAVFQYNTSELDEEMNLPPLPEDVDADVFWADIEKEVITRGVIRGGPNPLKISVSYHR
jgi:hypothetical protein